MDLGEAIVTGVMVGAAAVTGGVTADSNQTVVTGDSSASVQVTNVINSNNSGGTSHTIIEKTVDGVTVREETTEEFEPGEPIHVEASAEAVSGGQTVSGSGTTKVESEVATEEASSTPEEAHEADTATTTQSFVQHITSYVTKTISNLVSGFLGLWN